MATGKGDRSRSEHRDIVDLAALGLIDAVKAEVDMPVYGTSYMLQDLDRSQ